MLQPIDNFFLQHDEPAKSCLQALRDHILRLDEGIAESWSYGMPLYSLNNKRLCYLWYHKKLKQPYINMVEGRRIHHPDLRAEGRSRMKILLVDAAEDLPLKKIDSILKEAMALCK